MHHSIRSFIPEQPKIVGPTVQEMARTSRLPGNARPPIPTTRGTGPGTRPGILRRSGLVFENLVTEMDTGGGLNFGEAPKKVRKPAQLEKKLALQKKALYGLRSRKVDQKTIMASKKVKRNHQQTENIVTSVAVERVQLMTPELTEVHDSFSTEDSFSSLDSVVVHDIDRERQFKENDPILNPSSGGLHFCSRAGFTAFAKSVGLLHLEKDEQERRKLTIANVGEYQDSDSPRSNVRNVRVNGTSRSPTPSSRPANQKTLTLRRQPVRVPSLSTSGKLPKRSVGHLTPRQAKNNKRSRSGTPSTSSMDNHFAQHLIARAGGNEIINQVVISHGNQYIEDADVSDAYHASDEKTLAEPTARTTAKRAKLTAQTKIDGLQGAYRTLPPTYHFAAPPPGSEFVMAGNATSLADAIRQSKEAQARMGYSTRPVPTTGSGEPRPNVPSGFTQTSNTSTSRPTTSSADLLTAKLTTKEMGTTSAHPYYRRKEQLKMKGIKRVQDRPIDIAPAIGARSEHLRGLKQAFTPAQMHGQPAFSKEDPFVHRNGKKCPLEVPDTTRAQVAFSLTQPSKQARTHQMPSTGSRSHNELVPNLQASNVRPPHSQSVIGNNTSERDTAANQGKQSQPTPPPGTFNMALPNSTKVPEQEPPPPAQLERQHNHAYPFQPHPTTDLSLWPQIANHPPFPRIQPNQEPTSAIKELILGDTTGVDISNDNPRVRTCYNPANACLVHRGMKETPKNPHFEELQAIGARKGSQMNTGNMEYLEKKIHQGKAERIDYVPDSEFRTHYHDTQGYWTADRSSGQLSISEDVFNVQSALGAAWDCTTENGTKVAGRGYLESNHIADAGHEKAMHDAHQLGFSLSAKRIAPIVICPTQTAPHATLSTSMNVNGKPLHADVNRGEFLVDDNRPATNGDVVIGVGEGFIHGNWQQKVGAKASTRTAGDQNSMLNLHEADGQMLDVQSDTADTLDMEFQVKELPLLSTTTGGRYTSSDSDLDSVLGELRKEDPQVIQVGDFSVFIAPKNNVSAEAMPDKAMDDQRAIRDQQESNFHQPWQKMHDMPTVLARNDKDNTADCYCERVERGNMLNTMREVAEACMEGAGWISILDEPAAAAGGVVGQS